MFKIRYIYKNEAECSLFMGLELSQFQIIFHLLILLHHILLDFGLNHDRTIGFFLLVLVLYSNTQLVYSTQTCLKTYENLTINSPALETISGNLSTCCTACQKTSGCVAYSWDGDNTCWLRSQTQPLFAHSSRTTVIMSPLPSETYSLNQTYSAGNFFGTNKTNNFHFVTWGLTNVTTNVNQTIANSSGLIGYQNGQVYIGVDHTNVVTSGRHTTQLQSLWLYNSGLFILNLAHMPTGNGTWPSWWFSGPSWPTNGEIDVLEGVYGMNYNLISIHTGKNLDNCTMQQNSSTYFNGTWVDSGNKPYLSCYTNFHSNSTTNQGCSVEAPKGTFQDAFNAAGGGVFALQWDRDNYIRVWNFIKPNIPEDIQNNSTNPNPDTWGMPNAYIPLGSSCSPSHFNNMSMIFDIAFCGGWASQYFPGGEAACENLLFNDPSHFSEAYWLINYVKVFCKPGEPCGTYDPNCIVSC